jgi:hypothetical protein
MASTSSMQERLQRAGRSSEGRVVLETAAFPFVTVSWISLQQRRAVLRMQSQG